MAEPTGVQQLPVPGSPLPAIFDIAKYIGGQKSTSQGNGVTNTQGQTAPLESLIATLSDPNNLSALIGQLFNTGAAQVPGLTTQFANATGTRATNNSMLGQSLAMLNTNIMQQIAQAVVQQQQTAVQGAGKLAETNKTTQASENKTTVAKPASVQNAGGATAAAILGGTLLNHLGKNVFNPFDPKKDKDVKPTTSTTPDTTNVATPDLIQGIQPNFDVGAGAITMPAAIAGAGVDTAASIDPVAIAGIGNGFDVDSSVDTSAGDVAGEAAADSTVSTGAENLPDFSGLDLSNAFDFGFADGGLVIRIPMPGMRNASNGIPMPMADGGSVPLRRNVPNMGDTGAPAGTPAIMTPSLPGVGGPQSGPLDLVSKLVQLKSPNKTPVAGAPSDGTNISSGDGSAAASPGASVGSPPSGLSTAVGLGAQALGIGPVAALGPVGIGLGLVTAIGVALANAFGNNNIGTDLDGLVGESGIGGQAGPDGGNGLGGLAGDSGIGGPAGEGGGFDTSGLEGNSGVTGLDGPDGGTSPGPGPGSTDGTAPGPGDDGSGGNADGSGGTSDGSDGGSSGAGDGGSGGAGDGGAGEADGGSIKATTKKAKFGIDQQPIMATPGEFMLPLDTVNFIGQDVLDDLVSLTHIPLRGGRS